MRTIFTGGGFTIDHDASNLKEAFQFLGKCDEVFGAVHKCQNCGGEDLTPSYRKSGTYDFYSIRCRGCGWEFKFGQKKDDGSLFRKGWEPPYNGGEQTQQHHTTNGAATKQAAMPF